LVAGPLLAGCPSLPAEIGLVDFYDSASPAQWLNADRYHGKTDAMGNEPRGLEDAAKGTMKLVAANALLAGRHQEHGLQPMTHWNVAGLENGAYFYSKRLAALVALIGANPSAFVLHFASSLNATHSAGRPDRSAKSGFLQRHKPPLHRENVYHLESIS
jgi:hypothetical protein